MMFRTIVTCLIITICGGFFQTVHAWAPDYFYPKNGAEWIPRETPILIRCSMADHDPLHCRITIRADRSGLMEHQEILSDDQQTLICRPDTPFQWGELVTVRFQSLLSSGDSASYEFQFKIAESPSHWEPIAKKTDFTPIRQNKSSHSLQTNEEGVVILNGVSVPSDFPCIEIFHSDNPDPGYIFCNYQGSRYYNLILDNQGNPYFYWIVPDDRRDFKVQPNNTLTMTVRQGFGGGGYIAVDNTYTVVDTFFAPPGYQIDEHELVVLENGHYLVTAMDRRQMDMSQLVSGGKSNAWVTGYHLIEMDSRDEPVFIWRCWDHYEVTDAEYVNLTQWNIDFLHTNSIAVDLDGHYLICPKLLNEITKINRKTGEIIWRLGGKKNQFELVGFEDNPFYMQHSIRVLPNGHYTVFDNGNYHNPHFSRALELKVDETAMTATKVWEFRDTPDKQSYYQGNVQRLPNGNTLINWGMAHLPSLTEVRPDGSKAFEMNFENPVNTYRVFRFPWNGQARMPYVVPELYADRLVLLFNKFGDEQVQGYCVYGDTESGSNRLLARTEKPYYIFFPEDLSEGSVWFFRIAAEGLNGVESPASHEIRIETDFPEPGANLIENAVFEQGSGHWKVILNPSVSADYTTGSSGFVCTIGPGSEDLSDIQLMQEGITLHHGQSYLLQLTGSARPSRMLEMDVKSANPPVKNYSQGGGLFLKQDSSTWHHTFTMTQPTDTECRLTLQLGGVEGTVQIQSVTLTRVTGSHVNEPQGKDKSDPSKILSIAPNPFNHEAAVHFFLSSPSKVLLRILDIKGRTVHTGEESLLAAGRHIRFLDASTLTSGIYFCSLTVKEPLSSQATVHTGKMILIK
jgi:hypothetical protein